MNKIMNRLKPKSESIVSLKKSTKHVIEHEVHGFAIARCTVVPKERAVVDVLLLNKDNVPVAAKKVVLEGKDYQGWGNDDQYLIDFVEKAINGKVSI